MTTTVPAPATPSPVEYAEQVAERPYAQRLRRGDFDLAWLRAEPRGGIWGQWGVRAEPSERGLTLMDVDAASGLHPGPHAPPSVALRAPARSPACRPGSGASTRSTSCGPRTS